MRVLKGFGGVVAVVLLVAVFAASAGATAFEAGEYSVELKGHQEAAQVLKVEGLTVSCETLTLTGELYEPTEEFHSAAPTFTGCTASGSAATVAPEGCTLTLDATHSNMDVVCPTEKAIKVTAIEGNCEFKIGTQANLSKAEFTNTESTPSDVSMAEEATGIKYTKTKDGSGCPFSGTGEKADGTLSGGVQLEALDGATQVELLVGELLATQLCSIANSSPCTNPYALGSTAEAKLTGNTAIEFTLKKTPTTLACTESTIKGTTAAATSGGLSLNLNLSVLTFGTCGCTVTMTSPHAYFISGGGGNGTFELVSKGGVGPTMTVTCGLEKCVFQNNGVVGTVTGGMPAKLVYTKASMNLNAGASAAGCAGPLKLSASYEYKEPSKGEFWVTF